MSLIQERLEQAQEMSLGKIVKNYLDKRDNGTTFTVASISEALNLNTKENNRLYALLMNAAKTRFIKRLETSDDEPVTFRLDRDGDWQPRNSSVGVTFNQVYENDTPQPRVTYDEAAEISQDAWDSVLRPQLPALEEPAVIERRVLRFLSTLQPGSKFAATHIAERLAYHTTQAHNEIMRVLLQLRKDGCLKSIPGAGKPVFEVIANVKEPAQEQPEKPVEPEVVTSLPTPAPHPVMTSPASPLGVLEIQDQLLALASALDGIRSPLSAFTTHELAQELARRLGGET